MELDLQAQAFVRAAAEAAVSAAVDAGAAIMEIYAREDMGVELKADLSPVTLADKAADALIADHLRDAFPGCALLSEESAHTCERLTAEWTFIVDPLDGTKEFIARNGEFTVNIALCRRGAPVAGVVYAPAIERLFYAAAGLGAFARIASPGVEQHGLFAEGERIHVSHRDTALVVMASRSHTDGQTRALLERNAGRIARVTAAGSSLKGCLIACGEADVYYRTGPTMQWDTAAMQCVVEQAGGLLRQGDGSVMHYLRKSLLNERGFYILNRPTSALE